MEEQSSFALRAAVPADRELLWEIFRSSRAGPLADLPEELLRMQHRAQEASYAAAHGGADDCLIMLADRPAGRLVVQRSELEHRIVDIVILAPHRGRGVGTSVVRSLIDEARNSARPLRLTVAIDNAGARRLYRRLGFSVTAEDAANVAMEIAPPRVGAGQAGASSPPS